MYPLLFQYKFIKLHTYGLLIMIGFLIGMYLLQRKGKEEGMDVNRLADLSFYGLIGGLIGARILFVITQWDAYSQNPLAIFKFWEGGLVFYGGFLGGAASFVFFTKRFKFPLLKTVDMAAPSLAIAHVFGRLGCFAAGCCYGIQCDPSFPLAVMFNHELSLAPKNVHLHPAQLYDATNAFLIFLLLQFLYRKKKFDGQIIAVYGMVYAIGRYIVELFRGDPEREWVINNVLSTSQFIGLLLLPISIFLFFHWRKKAAQS